MHVRSILSIAALCAAATVVVSAQAVPEVKLPASPPGQAAVQLGGRWEKTAEGPRYRDGKWVVVDYSRPLLRGRTQIFGTGADYGKTVNDGATIWRAGANDTTRLTTQTALQIGDKTIAPGVYNVFVDLKPGQWTLVLNTQPVQPQYDPADKVRLYGAYNYDSKFDVLRAPMTLGSRADALEQFTIAFANATDSFARLIMAWERTVATIDLRVPAGTK
ncbi:MAG TPA: DUF2911 domain-containing protein [Vicinamibacterales bacterium]|nr:DUF2911 domain-containing protein [Vicinamibacterales bacterium]